MEAFCFTGHRWNVHLAPDRPDRAAVAPTDVLPRLAQRPRRSEPQGSWRCPACGAAAVVVHRVDGVEISFTVPADVRVVAGVLLVDANERRREALAKAIDASDHMCVVGHAADGVDALELAALIRPDAVVLAERMPVLDGLACLPALAAAAPDALVVFHASGLDDDLVQYSCAHGAVACVDEHVVVDVAVETLERLLGRTEPTTAAAAVTAHLARPA